MANRNDVLNDFTIEEELSHETLKVYLQRYPEYTQDLLALFNELSMNDLEVAEANLPLETKAQEHEKRLTDTTGTTGTTDTTEAPFIEEDAIQADWIYDMYDAPKTDGDF